MRVRLHQGQLDYFRRRARKHAPNELVAYLFGTRISSRLVEIEYIWYPEMEVTGPTRVRAEWSSVNQLKEKAAREGYYCMGTLHSHPNWVPVMSPTDYEGQQKDNEHISGIMSWETDKRSHVYFYVNNSPLPAKIEYFKRKPVDAV